MYSRSISTESTDSFHYHCFIASTGGLGLLGHVTKFVRMISFLRPDVSLTVIIGPLYRPNIYNMVGC